MTFKFHSQSNKKIIYLFTTDKVEIGQKNTCKIGVFRIFHGLIPFLTPLPGIVVRGNRLYHSQENCMGEQVSPNYLGEIFSGSNG